MKEAGEKFGAIGVTLCSYGTSAAILGAVIWLALSLI